MSVQTLRPITRAEARARFNAGLTIGVTVDPYPNGLEGSGIDPADWPSFKALADESAGWSRRGGQLFWFAPDPIGDACDACGAEPGEPCRPGCLGHAMAMGAV